MCPNAKICVVNNGIAALKQNSQGKKQKSLASILCKDELPIGKAVQAPLTNFITKVAEEHVDVPKEEPLVDDTI